MILTSDMYVPALRWRQGEYQALWRLNELPKKRVVPYITIPEIEFDFEENRLKKSLQEHVHPFAARYKTKWGKRAAWIGLHESISDKTMNDGRSVVTYIFDALRAFDAGAIPVIGLSAEADAVLNVRAVAEADARGVAVSVRLEDLMQSDAKSRLVALASGLKIPLAEIDLLIDLGAPNFEPYDAFASALIAALGKLGSLSAFRNFVLIGTSIPGSFKEIAKGSDQIPRHDWMFYRTVRAKLPKGMRCPNYGDYTIVHPKFTAIDLRPIKPAGKIVYTTEESWFVRKGGAFRDNPEQMHDHCAAILNATGVFKGPKFSPGDEYIAACADKKEKPSSLTWWKYVTINHHITHVLDDLAKLGAAS